MAATLKKELGADVSYIKSGGGVFEVTADGQLVFSKRSTGRFPTEEEIVNTLKKK